MLFCYSWSNGNTKPKAKGNLNKNLKWKNLISFVLLMATIISTDAAKAKAYFMPINQRNNADINNNKCLATTISSLPSASWWHIEDQKCPSAVRHLRNTIYVLYDVNHSEGFNLRRDVYVRLAVFMRQLHRRGGLFANVRLVLPPWPRLYHWNSQNIRQHNLVWRNFFDLESLRRFAPVIDFDEFLEEYSYFGLPEMPYVRIDHVYRLMHYDDMLESGTFTDKFEHLENDSCHVSPNHGGQLLRQPLLRYSRYNCTRFQGSASLLERLLRQAIKRQRAADDYELSAMDDVKVFAILGAETVLHDYWGDENFWQARRSMRFAQHLVKIAKDYRQGDLKTTDEEAKVQRPSMWEMERPYRNAHGGNYLCAHLRRGDFIQGRQRTTPTLKAAAQQIKQRLRDFNLTTAFVATDATAYELLELKEHFRFFRFKHFVPESQEQRNQVMDGGIAIIDQLICSYARYFIGTYESTFTYRIYEEREILGFAKRKTFNTICKWAGGEDCSRNTVWPIVY